MLTQAFNSKCFRRNSLLHATHDKLSVFNIVKPNTISKILEKILSGHETDDCTRISENSCRMRVSHTHTQDDDENSENITVVSCRLY
jgi:hypothetical protein